MKNSLTGFICTCLLVLAGNVSGRAQDQKPDPQQPPATPQQPATTPPPAPGQQPVPPAADQQPTQRGKVPEPPPPPPKVPDVRRPGESGYYIGVSGWFPIQKPTFDRASLSTFTGVSRFRLPGKPKVAEVVEVGLNSGLHNALKLIYTDFRASGNFTAPTDLVTWGNVYTAGTYMSSNYRVQSGKISYEYLTWPYPVGSRKFRLKTLWQVQLTQVNTVFDSPNNYYDSAGNLRPDPVTGKPIDLSSRGTKRIISPMLGLGAYYYPSRHLRFEANGSGFAFPHRYAIVDSDASLNWRILGHFELRLGGRAFMLKTSTHADYYFKGTFASAFFGLRWYSNSE